MEYIKVTYAEFISYKNSSGASIDYIENDNYYFLYLSNGSFKLETSVKKSDPVIVGSDQENFETNYKNLPATNGANKSSVRVEEQTPFAQPDYRTKISATSSWNVCSANTDTIIDFYITEERYVSGGEIIFKNSKEGDYITAEVYDKDGLIPEPYREILAENHPSMARYVVKRWLVPTEVDKYGSFDVNTYPLNARIPPGFYLRVTYHASSELGDRKCAVNYQLTKKL